MLLYHHRSPSCCPLLPLALTSAFVVGVVTALVVVPAARAPLTSEKSLHNNAEPALRRRAIERRLLLQVQCSRRHRRSPSLANAKTTASRN
ncbi:hypothetical protein NL676_011482 [Syzygium grande]|nr:hypothetical protein NL676_011482 [Syzygium grande]